ncbi:MAG: GGDEF domain-containing protein [Vicinamibacterales bacterium]|nr:GGDEF domain-containing protein [Vicinamibacterales bacterium]
MGYVLALLAVLLVAGGYFLGVRRRRANEDALKTQLDERSEQLTLVEHELLRRTSIDPVTHLPTQQYFQDFLEREWRRASRERTTVSIVMIEVDHFRAYNDRMGKPDGDACLRAVADAMRPLVHRPSDALARYGGPGKIGLVLGGTDAKGAMVLAERLRQAVENLQRANPASTSGPVLTISLGVAAAVPDREGAWQELELIAAAEKGLLQAMDAGRNRICLV